MLKLLLSLSLVFALQSQADEKTQAQVTFSGFPPGSTVFIDNYEKKFGEGNKVEFDLVGLKLDTKYLVETGFTDPVTQKRKSTLLHVRTGLGHRVFLNEMTEGSPSQSKNFDPNDTQKNILPPDVVVVFTERTAQ